MLIGLIYFFFSQVTIPESVISSSINFRTQNHLHSDSLLGTPEKARVPDQAITESGVTLTDYGKVNMDSN